MGRMQTRQMRSRHRRGEEVDEEEGPDCQWEGERRGRASIERQEERSTD
jgi:hypothetical protein